MALIDAEKLRKAIWKESFTAEVSIKKKGQGGGWIMWTGDCQRLIVEQPSVDAVPVVHAHWEKMQYTGAGGTVEWYQCSNCGIDALYADFGDDFQQVFSAYCPCCGAKMDEKYGGDWDEDEDEDEWEET